MFKTILLIDDDPAIRDSLELLLETAGYTVTTFCSGIQFLDSDFRSFHGCLLLDVRMPEKDGLTVLSEALEINPNLYIVMMIKNWSNCIYLCREIIKRSEM